MFRKLYLSDRNRSRLDQAAETLCNHRGLSRRSVGPGGYQLASMAPGSDTPNVAMVDPAAIELSFWETIKNSNNPDDFKSYLDKYPDGQFAALAKSRANLVRSAGNSKAAVILPK